MGKAKVITVANRRGGVGKSFCSIQLAINAAIGGPDKKNKPLKVLVVDADSQQNTTLYFLKYLGAETFHEKTLLPVNPLCDNKEVYNITDVFLGNKYMEYPTEIDNLFIIPSDGNIDNFREEFKNHPDRKITDGVIELFNEFIEEVEDDFDLIVIDTPPSKTYACQGALAASSHVLIPTMLDTFTVEQAIPNIIGDIERINKNYRRSNDPLKVIGILPNKMSNINLNNYERDCLKKLTHGFKQYLHNNFYFVERLAFKIKVLPQNAQDFEYMKKKDTADQMRGFYNRVYESVLKDIYKEKENANG